MGWQLLTPEPADNTRQLSAAQDWWHPCWLCKRKDMGKNWYDFQTLVNLEHEKYMAMLTPFGLWEWVVMPMGMRNSPVMHQRWVMLALQELIGKICHVYLDNIIIWLSLLMEHKKNVSMVLEALTKAQLYCSMKKSCLFTSYVDFLGHHISEKGIEVDSVKVARILNWLAPKTAKHIHQFLGLVRYIADFLPSLVSWLRAFLVCELGNFSLGCSAACFQMQPAAQSPTSSQMTKWCPSSAYWHHI